MTRLALTTTRMVFKTARDAAQSIAKGFHRMCSRSQKNGSHDINPRAIPQWQQVPEL